jgi:hypothetical protein
MLCEKFERGLKYLINRTCPAYVEECFGSTIDAAISAIRTGRVLTDDDLRCFLRQTVRELAGTNAQILEKIPAVHPQVISALRQQLTIFTPLQREVLSRYYVNREFPASICEALGLDIEHFYCIRNAAKEALRLRFNEPTQYAPASGQNGMVSRRGATSLFKVKWKTRAISRIAS